MKRNTREKMWVISVILLIFVLVTSGCDLYDSEPNYPKRNEPQVQVQPGQIIVHNNYLPNSKYDLTIFFSLWDSKDEQFYNKRRVNVGREHDCGSFPEGTYYIEIYEYQNHISTNPQKEVDSGSFRVNGGVKYDLYWPIEY